MLHLFLVRSFWLKWSAATEDRNLSHVIFPVSRSDILRLLRRFIHTLWARAINRGLFRNIIQDTSSSSTSLPTVDLASLLYPLRSRRVRVSLPLSASLWNCFFKISQMWREWGRVNILIHLHKRRSCPTNFRGHLRDHVRV